MLCLFWKQSLSIISCSSTQTTYTTILYKRGQCQAMTISYTSAFTLVCTGSSATHAFQHPSAPAEDVCSTVPTPHDRREHVVACEHPCPHRLAQLAVHALSCAVVGMSGASPICLRKQTSSLGSCCQAKHTSGQDSFAFGNTFAQKVSGVKWQLLPWQVKPALSA